MAVEVKDDAINNGIPVLKIVKTKCTSEISQQPDEKLFERAMSAVDHHRFTVANLSLRTLINTYPDSEFSEKSKLVLQDPRIAKCGESFSFLPSDCEGSLAATHP
jgi:TolA-binding protein